MQRLKSSLQKACTVFGLSQSAEETVCVCLCVGASVHLCMCVCVCEREREREREKFEILLHIGHRPQYKVKKKIIYINLKMKIQ